MKSFKKVYIATTVCVVLLCLSGCQRVKVKKERYPNGNLSGEVTYKGTKKHGKFTYYYNNGNLKQSGVFRNGKLHGKITYYFEKTDREKAVYNYKNGIRQGEATEYYEYGNKLKSELVYKNGELVNEKRYSPDGTLLRFKE